MQKYKGFYLYGNRKFLAYEFMRFAKDPASYSFPKILKKI